jgi:hypothetical protein
MKIIPRPTSCSLEWYRFYSFVSMDWNQATRRWPWPFAIVNWVETIFDFGSCHLPPYLVMRIPSKRYLTLSQPRKKELSKMFFFDVLVFPFWK